ncbi:unnamed protein product [Trifolium pratense]|uniref:Uncharacterized protein n=1 Tax=Trifolium pratense TaxID=57577 RepID=A0ACB0JKQ8_TRIPR|nr:unnamed protein product [Trifolium pratense]
MPIKRLKPTSQNQQQATKTAFVQVMVRRLKDFNRYRYFDPGGAIVPKSNARGFSWIQSQKATATVESPTLEQPTGPASRWPWVPRIISFQNRFMVVNEMCQREVQTFLLEMKGLSFTILISFSCCRKLRDSSEQIYSLLVDEGNITLTLLMEAIHVVDLLFLLLLQKCSIVCFYFPYMFYVSSVECLIVDEGSLTSQDLTNRLHTFNLVFTARDILVLEDSNKTHGAIIVEIALLNCVSLVSYFALMSYKIEYSNLAEIELVYVLISLDIVWKMMNNSIHGNVFKLTSGVYLLAIKCYVSMRCSSKIGFVKVGDLVAFVLGLLVNHILNLHVINQITSFQQCSLLNVCCCNCHPTYTTLANGKRMVFSIYWHLALNLFTTPIFVVAAHYSPRRSQLVFYRFTCVAIFHRKMINWGNVRDAKILIKWKDLPHKHGTCDCSSLRTRMFEGEGIVTGNDIRLIIVYFMSFYIFILWGCISRHCASL